MSHNARGIDRVACDGDGLPSFDRLRYRRGDGTAFLWAFELNRY